MPMLTVAVTRAACAVVLGWLGQAQIPCAQAQFTHLGGGVTTLTSNRPGFLAFLSGLLRRGSCDLPPLLLLPGLSLLLACATVRSLCVATVQLLQPLLLLGLLKGT